MTSLARRHVCITGGTEGIGLAVARLALARGARVSLIARRLDRLAEVADELANELANELADAPGTTSGEAIAIAIPVAVASADVADVAAATQAIEKVVAINGPVDVLITAAGYAAPGYFAELPAAEFRREMDVNYFGTLHAVRAVVAPMTERGSGHLVLVSSTAGLIGVFGYSAYSPTKFAVRGLGEVLRAELKPAGIKVSVVFPPDTDTPGFALENLTKPAETAKISGSITPRQPEAVAAAIISGIEHDRLSICADAMTAVLARGAGLAGPIIRTLMDRDVRSVQDRGPGLAG